MNELFTIAAGILLGGILLSMFLVAARKMADVEAYSDLPWWALAGWLVPLAFLVSQLYFIET